MSTNGLAQGLSSGAASPRLADIQRDQLRLLVTTLPAQAGGLDHTEHEQVVVLGVEDVEIQLRCTGILRPVQLVAGDEGVVELVAGGHEDQVVLGLFAVGEGHALPPHCRDIATRADVAVADMVQHQRVHHRMRLVQAVVRVGQTVLRGFADQGAHQQTVDQLFETAR